MATKKPPSNDTTMVDEKEAQKWDRTFRFFDLNGDGKIAVSELKNAFRSLSKQMSDTDIIDIVNSLDADEVGSITHAAFLQLMQTTTNHKLATKQSVEDEIFSIFDADRDGFVSKEDLKQALKVLKEELLPAQVNMMFTELDKDGDGKLSRLEFRPVLDLYVHDEILDAEPRKGVSLLLFQ
jgi:calcium-binding protein CML